MNSWVWFAFTEISVGAGKNYEMSSGKSAPSHGSHEMLRHTVQHRHRTPGHSNGRRLLYPNRRQCRHKAQRPVVHSRRHSRGRRHRAVERGSAPDRHVHGTLGVQETRILSSAVLTRSTTANAKPDTTISSSSISPGRIASMRLAPYSRQPRLITNLGASATTALGPATRLASVARRTAAKRIEFLLNTFLAVCAETSTTLSMLSTGMYPSSAFQFGSGIAFALVQADQSSCLPHSGCMMQPLIGCWNLV